MDNLRKWPILVTLLNWPKLDTAGTFGTAVCAKMFSDDCALSAYKLADQRIRAKVIFGPPKSTNFLGSFPLVPPLDNLSKWPILVTLLNWPKLDTASTFGAAVCAKMFSEDCALSAY